ncbi:MBL fold metallo-hydrolase, partial [Candidatus Pelagibacter sp.]|nr:MBL fold metallo-hydrolase [Candidatus Pelagibacter sp.]
MFKEISKLNHKLSSYKYSTISKAELIDGVNCLDNFFILKSDDKFTIYDRNCDHMGGKIITRNNIHECPVHKWRFDALKGKYTNGIKKKRIKDFEIKNNKIIVREKKIIPTITQINNKNNKGRVKIRFINHACLTVEAEDFKFATDPWAIGPAFNTGWWLKYESKKDWIEEINSCSFIYISHNHPDHLHPLTLSKIDKKIPIIVPNFISGATFKFIEELGFKKIIKLDFAKEYRFKQTNLIISILKSGDFREDSGIYFSIGKFTAL